MEDIHRFANDPVRMQQSLQWNVHGLWQQILMGLRHAGDRFENIRSIGVDTWGVDYALIDSMGLLAGPVRCYRDARTQGSIQRVLSKISRDELFEATGLQFIEINSIYQLFAAAEAKEVSLDTADRFLMIGDFFHWLLSGQVSVESTNASTTQLLDPRTKTWRTDVMETLGIPPAIFPDPTEPGCEIGKLQPSVQSVTGLGPIPIILPATHDTASAVLAVPASGFAPSNPDWCYISSGTWSLMGVELPEPKLTDACQALNFTNEGGIQGSTRLLKNIGGLWIFQQIRKSLERRGRGLSFQEMADAARTASPLGCLIDPDEPDFVAPDDMIDAIHDYAARTGQTAPSSDAELCRAALEGLAIRYRVCLGMLESITGSSIDTIHIVGGGSKNELLCQMTADACNRRVVAGPVEATAIGNLLMQMMGTGLIGSLEEGRQLVQESFPTQTFLPQDPTSWDGAAEKFAQLGQ